MFSTNKDRHANHCDDERKSNTFNFLLSVSDITVIYAYH